jgi:inositol-phosphate phosphatase/L-galactose 1-phosphate phosphatase/histidinol-phosphatase
MLTGNFEERFREQVRNVYPEHGVIGEEYGAYQANAPFVWTIDPIDGTENLVYGQDGYGILIGLRIEGEAVLGVIDHPEIGNGIRVSGGRGLGVRVNGNRLKPLTPTMTNPREELVAFSSYNTFARGNKQDWLFKLLPEFQRSRMLYACHAHSMALQGQLGAVVEVNLKIWDLTPAEALFPEVGGIFRELLPPLDRLQITNRHAVFGKPAVVDEIFSSLALS